MNRIRPAINVILFTAACVITLLVGVRVARQMMYGDPPPSSERSADFRAHIERVAQQRRIDWALFQVLANEDASLWTDERKDALIVDFDDWVDEGREFFNYSGRLSKEQSDRMKENIVVLAPRWLKSRAHEFAREMQSRSPRRRARARQREMARIRKLAVAIGYLDNPLGRLRSIGVIKLDTIMAEVEELQNDAAVREYGQLVIDGLLEDMGLFGADPGPGDNHE